MGWRPVFYHVLHSICPDRPWDLRHDGSHPGQVPSGDCQLKINFPTETSTAYGLIAKYFSSGNRQLYLNLRQRVHATPESRPSHVYTNRIVPLHPHSGIPELDRIARLSLSLARVILKKLSLAMNILHLPIHLKAQDIPSCLTAFPALITRLRPWLIHRHFSA